MGVLVLNIVEEFKDLQKYISWLNSIADKWRSRWEKAKIHEASPDERPKFFITAAFPYPNGRMHLGHARTYTIADIYARFKRMQGYNVLFPMGFHYTGTPVLALADKIKEGDPATLKLFKEVYKIPDEVIEKMKDPLFLVKYFHKDIKESMRLMGYAIDWRREFTSIDPDFSKFIHWQFYRLHARGYIKQGTHPVGWDPVVGTPVSMHDTKGDVEPEIGEFTLLFFTLDDGTILPAATLRPETVFGAINVWVNPSATYVKARVDDRIWIISEQAAEKLKHQLRSVEILEKFSGERLVGLWARNPATGWKVPVLPAFFVDPDIGTGIVMSVPAHAPYDYAALKDVVTRNKDLLEKIGVASTKLSPIPVVEVPGKGRMLAIDVVESMGIKSQFERNKLDEATREVYSIEFKQGIVVKDVVDRVAKDIPCYERNREFVEKYIAGRPVPEARDNTVKWLMNLGLADKMYEIMNAPVYSRWGNKVIVKILENQWFIDYGIEEWKRLAREALTSMRIMPPVYRRDFEETIEWLRRRACARTKGLGTKLPWDPSWIIESLSDSTIYMAFYTVNYILREAGVKPEQLDIDVWDYIFLGKGDPEEISRRRGIPVEVLERARREFEYWYPVDSRHSGKDLIKNHLTFYIFNHVAIFPRDKWPRQIVVNGYILYHGQKMSKSLYNVIPVMFLARRLSPDGLRLSLALISEVEQDLDFREDTALDIVEQLRRIHTMIMRHLDVIRGYRKEPIPEDLDIIDKWILSIVYERLRDAEKALENLRIREAGNIIYYLIEEDVKRYIELLKKWNRYMDDRSKRILAHIFDCWIRAMAPYTPHFAEEMWELIGGEGFVVNASWPRIPEKYYDPSAILAIEYIDRLVSDIKEIIRVRKLKPKRIIIHVVEPGKYEIIREAIKYINEGRPMKEFIREIISRATDRKTAAVIARQVFEYASSLTPRLRDLITRSTIDEKAIITLFNKVIAENIGAEVEVYYDTEPQAPVIGKRKISIPLKPAIYIEFVGEEKSSKQ